MEVGLWWKVLQRFCVAMHGHTKVGETTSTLGCNIASRNSGKSNGSKLASESESSPISFTQFVSWTSHANTIQSLEYLLSINPRSLDPTKVIKLCFQNFVWRNSCKDQTTSIHPSGTPAGIRGKNRKKTHSNLQNKGTMSKLRVHARCTDKD